MSRLQATLAKLRARNEGALIPFLTMGYPSLAETPLLIEALAAGGADVIELGVAFSDPMADGPTIQACSQKALANGITLKKTLAMIAEVRKRGVSTPFVLMGYVNPFLAYGLERFAIDAAAAGVDGVIVADLPLEEAEPWRTALQGRGLDLISFVSPTTREERLAKIAQTARGFLYCLAVNGVTGARSALSHDLGPYLAKVRQHAKDTPLAVGFGLSTPAHIAEVLQYADAAIVASALIAKLEAWPASERCRGTQEFIASLKAATLKP